ncbi:hypothetical protein LMH87_006127 [Akanthomyces muscarius]|uniref:Uncharacterized protein n=1 Tax=Akanthomyces muscarius TaxID=2231603 RepID=A0A9W8QPP9_AKAMU|nr:hypothetical protein LMH87_006127 [Akanthomyces muscarius]KAJ4164451.1 hypothetical protein LMH87_006127 [Akanthomyces muscarius]
MEMNEEIARLQSGGQMRQRQKLILRWATSFPRGHNFRQPSGGREVGDSLEPSIRTVRDQGGGHPRTAKGRTVIGRTGDEQ